MNPSTRTNRRLSSIDDAQVCMQTGSLRKDRIFSLVTRLLLNAATLILFLSFANSTSAQSGTWTAKTQAPTSPGQLGVINGIIYGIDANSVLESYNPVTDTWAILPPMPTPRGNESVGVANGLLYALGGCLDNACSSFVSTV